MESCLVNCLFLVGLFIFTVLLLWFIAGVIAPMIGVPVSVVRIGLFGILGVTVVFGGAVA